MESHNEAVIVRRRNRLKNHFTMTSNVLLFGYRKLTDAEKITYQMIDSFDWSDGAGLRKGYAYPSEKLIADARGLDERTIRRHLGGLERAGLLTREPRPGRTSILWIEDPSAEESEHYLSTLAMGPDTDVRGTPDTDVPPYKKDKGQARQNHAISRSERTLSAEEAAKREWLVGEMLVVVGGPLDGEFYRRVAATVSEHRIFEALSEVKLAAREGRITKSKRALFASLIRMRRRGRKEEEDVRQVGEGAGRPARGTSGRRHQLLAVRRQDDG